MGDSTADNASVTGSPSDDANNIKSDTNAIHSSEVASEEEQGNDNKKLISTPKLEPILIIEPKTPTDSSLDSIKTSLSLSSPPLTPPRRIMSRLTPVGKFSPKKRANSTDDDLRAHELRRLNLINSTVNRVVTHTNSIKSKVKAYNHLKQLKKEKMQKKFEKAFRNRDIYIQHKKLIATNTIKSISSSSASISSIDTRILGPFNEDVKNDRPKSSISETSSNADVIEFKFSSSLSSLRNLKLNDLFSNIEGTIRSVKVSSAYSFIKRKDVANLISDLFVDFKLKESENLKNVNISVAVRFFLFSLVLLIEKEWFLKSGRTPLYKINLEGTPHECFIKSMEDFPNLQQYHLDDNYYNHIVDTLLVESLNLWKCLSEFVKSNGDLQYQAKFCQLFNEGFYPSFLVFKHNHWFRSLVKITAGDSYLTAYMSFIKTMQNTTTPNINLDSQYSSVQQLSKRYMKQNQIAIDQLKENKSTNIDLEQLEKWETGLFNSYKQKILSGKLDTENPMISSKSSCSPSLTSGIGNRVFSKPTSLVPPSFSVEDWRRILLKIFLEFKQYQRSTLALTLRSGQSPFRAKKSDASPQFEQFIKFHYQPDIESIRAWLGIRTYSEGCIEAIERLSYLNNVDEMMVDIVQMVERCLYALYIVVQDASSKVSLVFLSTHPHREANSKTISFLSDSVLVLNKLQSGRLSQRNYFKITLDLLSIEIPGFLRKEADVLLDRLDFIDLAFVQKFVELIKDCMILGINNCISTSVSHLGDNIIEFEREMFCATIPSSNVSLNLRFPNLFGMMMTQMAIIDQGDLNFHPVTGYKYFNNLFVNFVCSSSTTKKFDMPEFLQVFSVQISQIAKSVRSVVTLQSIGVILGNYHNENSIRIPNGIPRDKLINKTQLNLISFVYFLIELEGFITAYFNRCESNKFDTNFKEQVYKILSNNAKEKLLQMGFSLDQSNEIVDINFDLKTVDHLIQQAEKVNIGSSSINSLKTIYIDAIIDILINEMHDKTLIPANGCDAPVSDSDIFQFDVDTQKSMVHKLSVSYGKFYKHEFIRSQLKKIVSDYYEVFNACFELYSEMLSESLYEFVDMVGGGSFH